MNNGTALFILKKALVQEVLAANSVLTKICIVNSLIYGLEMVHL